MEEHLVSSSSGQISFSYGIVTFASGMEDPVAGRHSHQASLTSDGVVELAGEKALACTACYDQLLRVWCQEQVSHLLESPPPQYFHWLFQGQNWKYQAQGWVHC